MNRREREDDLEREIRSHLDLEAEESGRDSAHRQFGNVMLVKEDVRQTWGWARCEQFLQELSYSVRRLRMAPVFTIATVLTLALGIGAMTSIFTLVHAVILNSLPVANPDELYRLGKETHCCFKGGYSQDGGFSLVSYDLYVYLRDHTKGFAELAAMPSVQSVFGVRRAGSSEPAQIYPGEFVSGNYFTTFGLKAFAGRTLTAEDDQPSAAPVTVMSYRLWQQKYRSDSSVIGSVFNVDEKPITVVGIAPEGFYGDTMRSSPPDFFLPLNTEPLIESASDLNKTDLHWLDLIGRVRPGTNPESVEAEMRVGLHQWLDSHLNDMSAGDRATLPKQTLYLAPGGAGITALREKYEQSLRILMTVSGFVLLIVCANVANLMLVRGVEQRRQISVSMALGAQTSRVMRQPLMESVILSLLGGVAGLGIAFAGTRLILHFAFPPSPGLATVPISASPSMPVLLFAFLGSLSTGVAFGITPAWMATRVHPIEALRGASRSTARAGSLPRKALVVLQVALSLVLLSAAGLLVATLRGLESQNFGFEMERRLVATTNPKLAGYRAAQLSPLYRRIHDSIVAIPGVSSAALCLYSPPGGGWGAGVWVDGHPAPGPKDDNFAAWDRVTPGYFDVVGTPILDGRGITEQDTASSPHVAVVTEAFAQKFFGNENPIGKHFGRKADANREFEVVGIAKNARYFTRGLDRPADPLFFLPETQADYTQKNMGSLFLHDVVILTKPGASVSAAEVSHAIASVDPNLPVISLRPLREQVSVQFTQPRLIARLTSLFGLLALALASIGLYGITAYNAGHRKNEIGIRIAVGAGRAQIIMLVLRGAFALICTGLLIGLPLALAIGRLLGSLLYGMNPYNPTVFAVAVGALCMSALIASIVPATRASLISPLDALRNE